MQKVKIARDEHGVFNVWTVNGNITFTNNDNGVGSWFLFLHENGVVENKNLIFSLNII